MTLQRAWVLCVTALALSATSASAQPTVDWSGLAYVDYRYLLASADAAAVGDNSFDYRRIYLTADVALDDAFDARVRLEATTRSTTAQGRPSPFVKDAWVRWRYAPDGHRATLGVQPPPVFEVAETVWGYRSLAQTLTDRTRLRESRDFGLRADGPLGGSGLRYSAMVANGNGVQREDAGANGKRVYGQLAYLPDGSPLRATLGADYTESDPDDGTRQASTRASAFVGAVTERARGGVEVAYVVEDPEAAGLDTETGVGVSVFGAVALAPRTRLVARYDFAEAAVARSGVGEHYVLVALAQRLAPSVQLMPNVIVERPEGGDAEVLGRVTVDIRF
ncbi:porin [Rubrivirga sp. IMCC45206]|uniref:porin n=1 Tax=Rubrivirga sp. IMCC45206 TaxID=3391614 RepID=UPI00398FCD09